MLEHSSKSDRPARAVILGAGGFVGGAAKRACAAAGVPTLALARRDVDLLAQDAAGTLAGYLRPDDSLVVVSARAPCRDAAMFVDNVRMMGAVCEAVGRVRPAHIVYISSDAVYSDSPDPLDEDSPTMPGSMHGAMHVAREAMLRDMAGETPLAILRPTLLYGASDPHNGYGPNRFRRQAAAEGKIVLFGNGEERRDHVLIEDLGDLVRRVVERRSRGILNVATGRVMSFRDIAEIVAAQFDPKPLIEPTPRSGPMPHNGYRPFDPTATATAFPDFAYTPLEEGLVRVHRESFARGGAA